MPGAAPVDYFPPPRRELVGALRAGDGALHAAMRRREARYKRGAVLFEGGKDQRTIYRLVDGMLARVRLLEDGRRQVICFFLPGDLLALKAMLFDRQPDRVECVAASAVEMLGSQEAVALAAANSDVAIRFIWQLAEDERRLHNSVTMLGRGDTVERVSAMLIDLTGRLAKLGVTGEARRQVRLRQQDIADYLGITAVHVNRTLRAMRERGLITVASGRITVVDEAGLARQAAPLLDIFEREAPEFGLRE